MYPSTVARFTKISGKHNVTRKAQRALIRVMESIVVNPSESDALQRRRDRDRARRAAETPDNYVSATDINGVFSR